MLSTPERIAFVVLVLVCVSVAAQGFLRIVALVRLGGSAPPREGLVGRFVQVLVDIGLQRPMLKARPLVGVLHAFLFFGFSFYLLVNVNDLLEAFVAGWTTIGKGPLAGAFNLFSDLFSILVIVGMVFFLVRRFGAKPEALEIHANVLLHPKVAAGGIARDSLIVGVFILLHVGSRWLGTVLHLAEKGHGDPFLPIASLAAPLFSGLSPAATQLGIHVCWWLAMGLIVLFLPYFPRSKHLHLLVAPLNLALSADGPRGRSEPVADSLRPGAGRLTELAWPRLVDPFACIMCNRCQDACPAHASGTPLSPAALEINKRYLLDDQGAAIVAGGEAPSLLDTTISAAAAWSCTTCYACVRVCPVGNAPMFDIVDIRRRMVFDGETPEDLAEVLRNLDEKGNSFGQSARRRSRWAKKLGFKIPDARKEEVEYLWFVGDFASYDPQCQEVSKKVARILHAAGVSFGMLYEGERSAGNDVRRAGEEGLFEELREQNAETLAGASYERIFTTDPHTFNALRNEYGRDSGSFEVLHYSTLLASLVDSGGIRLDKKLDGRATYHDPCYLGRYNGGFEAPRKVIEATGLSLVEMPRNRESSFCCGAGGGRIWMKDHDDMGERPSESRIREALELGSTDYFVVACPKDLGMYRDAVKTSGNEGRIEVMDIADFVADAMGLEIEAG